MIYPELPYYAVQALYEVPQRRSQFHSSRSPLRQGSYRALAATANHFARESAMDEVIRRSGLPASAVSVTLLSLEMKRLIKQLPGKLFVRNR